MFEEIFSYLKRIEPPLETRISNRMAVAAELSSLRTANRRRCSPWWRRSIAVPVPIAASLLVALAALALQSSIRGGREPFPTPVAAHDQPAEHATDAPRDETAIAKRAADARPVLKYRETETYLCGIGRLSSESGHFIKEQSR